ncbi:putative NAD(P)-binding protein [Seiridium unicorne]|uniref:NAD(P)-binding protein n=1 Tax=Seiridium unicorne TaxID=138068 RepID=A0ABR2UGT0_9PEZI
MAPTTILVSGASRGLGKGFVERYLAATGNTVIAAVRDLENPNSKALHQLPTAEGSKLVVVKIDSNIEADHADAVKTLAKEGVDSLDVVVANAGICELHPAVSNVTPADLQRHINTNVWGVLWLYQATLPLLLKSSNPRWVTMGSAAGSIQPPIPNSAYGPTKAMVHWYTKRMNAEEETLTAFVADPDWAATDMGNHGAKLLGMERAPVDPDDSIDGIVKIINEATKATHGGLFINYKGDKQSW